MKIEHTAFPVQDPIAVAKWYVQNLGLRIARQSGAPTYTHFLTDEAGTIIEIYNNPRVTVPDYANADPLLLHIALLVDDMDAECDRLLRAGCTVQENTTQMPDGDTLTMLRDPWGISLQLVKRSQPMK